jgi:hypothetical protein
MAAVRRLAAGSLASLMALVLMTLPAQAATRPTATPRPAAPVRVTLLPPQVYQVSPLKVNPTVQPNIMILGQYLTPKTTVQIGGHLATTVEVPDANHLLMKLPDNLSQGSYGVEVTNEVGSVMASDKLVIDSGTMPSTMMMLVGGGFLVLLLLVMRLARLPGLA